MAILKLEKNEKWLLGGSITCFGLSIPFWIWYGVGITHAVLSFIFPHIMAITLIILGGLFLVTFFFAKFQNQQNRLADLTERAEQTEERRPLLGESDHHPDTYPKVRRTLAHAPHIDRGMESDISYRTEDELLRQRAEREAEKFAKDVFRIRIRRSEAVNLYDFYIHTLIKLNEFCVSAKSAAGGQTEVRKGAVEHVGSMIELLGDTVSVVLETAVDPVPIAGPIIHVAAKWAIEKPLSKVGHTRQTNIMRQISGRIGFNPERWQERVARMLTRCYEPQIRRLISEPEQPTTSMRAKEALLRYHRLKPAEKLAEFFVSIIIEALIGNELSEDEPLDAQLIRVVQQSPVQQHHRLFGHNAGTVHTVDGKNWRLDEICTRCGVQTKDGRYFAGYNTATDEYGFCIGTKETAAARGLTLFEQEMSSLLPRHAAEACDGYDGEEESSSDEEPLHRAASLNFAART